MTAILSVIASWMHILLPSWLRLPDLTFSMPHTAYWLGLALFPAIAMFLVHRAESRKIDGGVSVWIAYLLWFWAGFAGLHRFYVKSVLPGFIYVGLFVTVLFGNKQANLARNASSDANNTLRDADFKIEYFEKRVEQGRAGAEGHLAEARDAFEAAQVTAVEAGLALDQWGAFVGGLAAIVAIFLMIDAVLIPRFVRACAVREANDPPPAEFSVMMRGPKSDPRRDYNNAYTRTVDSISGWSGRFVAYWSMIAVFVYYYEVIARYVFNSPTNWAHEGMFLMFGMQYLISGAYALRDDAHVRVDVIFERFSLRSRALIDIITSFFFFVFTITLLVTGFIFASNAVSVWEVSFTEWAIQYWPVKLTISLGALLLVLQGSAKLIRDVTYFVQAKAQ